MSRTGYTHRPAPLDYVETYRPRCPECHAPETIDLDGVMFECLVCGDLFKDLFFRLNVLETFCKTVEAFRELADEEELRSSTYPAVRPPLADVRLDPSDLERWRIRNPRPRTVLARHCAPPEMSPAPPKPPPPPYARLAWWCEAKVDCWWRPVGPDGPLPRPWRMKPMEVVQDLPKSAEEQRADESATAAYAEWQKRHSAALLASRSADPPPPGLDEPSYRYWQKVRKRATLRQQAGGGRPPSATPKTSLAAPSLWSGEPAGSCPRSREPAIRIMSDVLETCCKCGHQFWGARSFGVGRGVRVCLCCHGDVAREARR